MQKIRVLERKKPLCFYDNHLLLSNNNKLYSLNSNSFEIEYLLSISGNYLRQFLGKNRYFYRLLRLGIHYAVYAKGKIYIVYAKKIYALDITDNTLAVEFTFNRGKGPLTMTVVDQPFGNFDSGIYFGEYFNNPNKEEVNVYFKAITGSDWINMFTFPKGTINHIHSIVPDRFRNKMWILTGDFDDAAGMWIADESFNTVRPVVIGSQKFRACVAFPTKQGLLYATDSHLERNHICLLQENTGGWFSTILHEINGSCIYGCKVGKNYVFSTSTEPGLDRKSRIGTLLDKVPGPGILKNESHILLLDDNFNLKVLDVKKKDCLPYRLFQFGTFMFPHGHNDSDWLFSYNVANRGCDLSTDVWDLS